MIKFLLIMLVVMVGIWLWRSGRPVVPPSPKQPAQPLALEMVRCSVCAVHLPVVDAVKGKKGVYCSADHLHRAES
ncbi:MAG: hypothetical protein ACI9I0_002848 [Rhodoferax sp.]|jgi:uncharacterized protein